MNENGAKLTFIKNYVHLLSCLSQRKSFQGLTKLETALVDARTMTGVELDNLVVAWHTQCSRVRVTIQERDPKVLGEVDCFRDLCLSEIFASPKFSDKSKANLWLYIDLLCESAAEAARPLAESQVEAEIPHPSYFSSVEDQEVMREFAAVAPKEFMEKIHLVIAGMKTKIMAGQLDPSSINFSEILKLVCENMSPVDMINTFCCFQNSEDMWKLMNKVSGVLKKSENSQTS